MPHLLQLPFGIVAQVLHLGHFRQIIQVTCKTRALIKRILQNTKFNTGSLSDNSKAIIAKEINITEKIGVR